MRLQRPGRWAAGLLAAALSFPLFSQEVCLAWHGPGGNSVTEGIPSIAGQPQLFLETPLVLMREELRSAPQMLPIVKGMKDAEITRLACGVCHTADFSGQNQVPRLAGQREEYLVSEMLAYRDGKRKGGDTIMAAALYGVSDADISALAHFLSRSLRATPGSTTRAPAR